MPTVNQLVKIRARERYCSHQIACLAGLPPKTGRLHPCLYHNPEKAELCFEKGCPCKTDL